MRFSLDIFVLLFILVITIMAGLAIGATQINISEAFAEHANPDAHIFWQIRMPRVLLGIIVGAHFAISGMILQTTTRNALADPGILGISGGAILFVTIYVMFDILLNKTSIEAYDLSLGYLPMIALIGGVLGATVVFALCKKSGFSPGRFVLIGIAVSSFCQAVSLGLVFGWGPTKLDLLWIWISGSLYNSTWKAILFILPWTLLGSAALLLSFKQISMLRLDEDSGIARGFFVQRWRFGSLILACIFAGPAVGVVGPVGFVGLIVPHIARKLMPFSLTKQFIATALIGPILIVFSDILGRFVFAPAEVPIGVITSLIGAPFLFFLLFPMQNKFFRLRFWSHVTR